MEQVPPGYVAVGRVSTSWGVRGVVKVIPLVDSRERLAPGRRVTVTGQHRTIESSRWQKGLAYLKLSGIDDREAAFTLRQRLLTVPESELDPLDEGHYYRFQLVGLAVETTAGAALGRVTDVLTTGANDVYVVQGERGEILVPATDDIVKEIDLERGRMVIEEVPGLLQERRRKR
jgi:16S rRNA processing protein RimM